MKTELRALRAKIRGFELEATDIRSDIGKAHKEKKSLLWDSKRRLGFYTRAHLIAYGLLREVPYVQIEPKCGEHNQPNIDDVLEVIHAHVYRWDRRHWDKARVEALLKRPEPTQTVSEPVMVETSSEPQRASEGLIKKLVRLVS